jgi:metal-responsive CopG/Arc/MetJ family transcriptional regulator
MTPGMTRPYVGPQIGVRIEQNLLERVDALVLKLRTPWHEPTRSDVVRALIIEGLPALEAKAAKVQAADLMAAPVVEPEHEPAKGRKSKGGK